LLLAGCKENVTNPNKDITMEAFSKWKTPSMSLKSFTIRENLAHLCRADKDSTAADYRVRSYYRSESPLLWIDRLGVDARADTLLAFLKTVGEIGFTERSFCVAAIESDLARMRSLTFDSVENANAVAARLEYHLTKAYLRYAVGQRFGYVNPHYVLNRLDALEEDSTGRALSYRKLYDVDTERPDKAFFAKAFRIAMTDSIGQFLRQSQPASPFFHALRQRLATTHGQRARMLLLCNMERCRWRERHPQDTTKGKYIVVNIPAFHLYAHGADTLVDMRVGGGSVKTKTPLLVSAIERMDVNPVWNIPMSIVRKDIVRHAGDPSYFDRNRYYVVERKTGKRVATEEVTASMLLSGNYRVTQEGGEGNALGRIIFRFPNNFSVFLHDTSSRSVFGRDNRGVSHGCIRVERPFDLARFLLDNPDDWLLDKLRITMGLPPETERGIKYMEDAPESPRLVGSLAVKPRTPLYIIYFTLYPDATGTLREWPDVYGYDAVIERGIKPFME